MPEITLPSNLRERRWIDLRDRLARAVAELRVSAASSDAANGHTMLVIAGNLAGLALSIHLPAPRKLPGGLVDPATLLAAQILQPDTKLDDETADGGEHR